MTAKERVELIFDIPSSAKAPLKIIREMEGEPWLQPELVNSAEWLRQSID
jgi:hypothetical protein